MRDVDCIPCMLKWSGEYNCKFEETYQTLSLTSSEVCFHCIPYLFMLVLYLYICSTDNHVFSVVAIKVYISN